MSAININVPLSQFSHPYLYSGMRKNVGQYFLSNLRSLGGEVSDIQAFPFGYE
jgi:hypothetical protein